MIKDLSTLEPKIILTNSLTIGRRFVHKCNLGGVSVTNYSIHSMRSLLGELLIRINPNVRLINDEESAYIILKLISKNNYGLKAFVKSIGASLKLLEVINDYRLNNNLSFNSLIKASYHKLLDDYKGYLSRNNLVDYVLALNSIKDIKRKEKIYLMSDISLRKLELEILNRVFDNQVISIDEEEKPVVVEKVFECYGQYGELLNALNYIENNEIPLGDVEIVYTDSIFENLIKGTCDARKIPYTLKVNHAKTTNLVSFICDILNYFKEDFKYELLEKVLSNQGLQGIYLKQFYQTISFPKYIVGYSYERSLEFLKAYEGDEKIKDFYNLFSNILSVIDNGKLDYLKLLEVSINFLSANKEIEALSNKLTELNYLFSHEDDFINKIDLILRELEKLTYSEKDNKDMLSFINVSKSFTLRPYVIVLGMNQNLLSGSDVENAFIKDLSGYEKDLKEDENICLSKYQKRRTLNNLKYYLSHSNSHIILSYSSDNKIDLRDMAEGVYLLEIKDTPATIIINAYDIKKESLKFKSPELLSDSEEVEQDYDNGEFKEIEDKPIKDTIEEVEPEIIEEEIVSKPFTLSPSALKTLMNCPLEFYYQKILGIISVDYPSLDESIWLEANALGTFFHEIMELYLNKYINKKVEYVQSDFDDAFERAKEEAIKINPITNEYIANYEIDKMKITAQNYLKKIIGRGDFALYKVLYNEKKLDTLGFHYPKCKSLLFSGSIDRVDGYVKDGVLHLRIIDYKTGKYKDKDSHGYYQHILYPYVLKNGLKANYKSIIVDKFIYAYPLDSQGRENIYEEDEINEQSKDYQKVMSTIDSFVITYLENKKDYLIDIIDYFDETYEAQDAENGSICIYCRYKKECIKRVKEGYRFWKEKK